MPDQVGLLRAAEASVRQTAAMVGGQPGALPGVEHRSFAELLLGARTGAFGSERQVTIESDAGVSLSPAQLTQLALAADSAEAAGVRTALVLLDGAAVVLDVATRRVVGTKVLSSGVVSGVDGVVDLRSDAQASPTLGIPSVGVPAGISLARLLGGAGADDATTGG